MFKTILALLTYHKDNILACDGFEQIMDYLKITVPIIDKPILDNVVKMVSEIFLNLTPKGEAVKILFLTATCQIVHLETISNHEAKEKRLTANLKYIIRSFSGIPYQLGN